jgi:hypothetical protein
MTGGIWGLLSVGLLSQPDNLHRLFGADIHPGFLYSLGNGNDARLLACQVIGIAFIFGWTLVTMLPFFLWLNFMGWFRCESVQELVGLDITYNAGSGGIGEVKAVDDEDVKEEYLDAYQRYRQNMRNTKTKAANKKRGTEGSTGEDESDE